MIDHLSMIRALIGSRSQIWIPGTLVDIAPNSPRYSKGAYGLGSHVSCWLGPPRIQRMITDFSREAWACLASARSTSAKDKPASPSTPTFRKLRRSMASSRRNSGQPRRLGARTPIAPSMVKEQFLRVEDRPEDILVSLPFGLPLIGLS